MPDHVTAAYGWTHGQPLTESLLVKCEEEASTLEECAARLQPLLAEQNRKDLGMAIALLHGSLKRAEGGKKADDEEGLRSMAEKIKAERENADAAIKELRDQAERELAANKEMIARSEEMERKGEQKDDHATSWHGVTLPEPPNGTEFASRFLFAGL